MTGSMLGGRRAGAAVVCVLSALALAGGIYSLGRPLSSFLGVLTKQVPEASAALHFTGKGFPRRQGKHIPSDDAASDPNDRTHSIEAQAPVLADEPFIVGAIGLAFPTSIALEAAAKVPVELDHGIAIYRSVYQNTDVVAVRDPDHVELAYVVRDVDRAPVLRLEVTPPDERGTVTSEPGTGAVIVRGADKRALLRVEPPVALDHAGNRRSGRYRIDGHSVRIDLALDGLVAPVLIDPIVAVPFWTILSDGRAPGAVVYDPTTGSKETRVVFDPRSGSTLLVRPIRSQQYEDSSGGFAQLSRPQSDMLSPLVRTSAAGGPTSGAAERREWQRIYYTESETWEWANNKWSLRDSTGLPGRIDPALSFDPARQTMVMAGGQATTDFVCGVLLDSNFFVTGDTCTAYPDTSVYEFDGSAWSKKDITGAPPPRVRNGLAAFNGGTILFGGRHIGAYHASFQDPVNEGPPFPDNLAQELLNDTWVYDGASWEPRPTNNAPSPRESAQLAYDPNRGRTVLVGGMTAGGVDSFDLWEFDGTDWIQRFAANDPALPLSLRGRSGALVAWNPVRGTTLIFGGIAKRLDSCTLSDSDIGAQATVPARKDALTQLGCFGGYVHDSWEWDGSTLRQLTRVAYGGLVGDLPIFRQIADQGTWGGTAPSVAPTTEGGKTPLLPWRYDASSNHFPLRSTLERAHAVGGAPATPVSRVGSTQISAATVGVPSLVSPLFGSRTPPQLTFDTTRGVATIFTPEDGHVFETDGKSWSDRTPASSPFADGGSDFFGATWDSVAQRILLFDPVSGTSWSFTDAGGWSKLNPTTSPPVWSIDPSVRRERDLEHVRSSSLVVEKVAQVARQIPQLTFDRGRNRAVMLYRGGLWEFDGSAWSQRTAPPGWANCTAATLLAYDGARAKTVAVGCNTPGQTMEWDGASWRGPMPGPYQDPVERVGPAPAFVWQGTLQLSWAHPNAIFESALLGGISTFDASGRLRTWDGTQWVAGPQLSEGNQSDSGAAPQYGDVPYKMVDELNTGAFGVHADFVPFCLFPPAIEDSAHGRILAFRDGVTGMREWRKASGDIHFSNVFVGDRYRDFGDPLDPYARWGKRVHPHPFELLSAEHIYTRTSTDPASRFLFPTTYPELPGDGVHGGAPRPGENWRTPESEVNNLFWPFRVFVDPLTQRVRVLTHRGAVWELGAELRQGLGETCTGDSDCTVGYCIASQKNPGTRMCCDFQFCATNPCQTCEGTKPGTCEDVPAGQPEPFARCGSGDCAGTCSGQRSCVYPAGQACGSAVSCSGGTVASGAVCAADSPTCVTAPGTSSGCPRGLGCASATTCLNHCTTDADCGDPHDMCAPDGNSCVPNPRFDNTCQNGILTKRGQNTGTPCPGGLGCADANSCRSACVARLDCASVGDTCSSGGTSCTPDGASVLATARGVTPVNWSPPKVRSPEEIAATLKSLGYPEDADGGIDLPGAELGAVQLAFDPTIKNPLMGVRTCIYRIEACMVSNRKVDACVAATPRCVGNTPWLGDDAGLDCCPEACLEKYFERRSSANERVALDEFMFSGCYPGLTDFMSGGARP